MYRIKVIETIGGTKYYVPQAKRKILFGLFSVWSGIDNDAEYDISHKLEKEADAIRWIDTFKYHRTKKINNRVKSISYNQIK